MDDNDLHLVDLDALVLHHLPLIGEMVMDIFLQPYIGCVSFATLRESLDYMLPIVTLHWFGTHAVFLQNSKTGYWVLVSRCRLLDSQLH